MIFMLYDMLLIGQSFYHVLDDAPLPMMRIRGHGWIMP